MKVFLDSSALAKRYIKEIGTEQVNDLFNQSEEIFISAIAYPEIISALSRNKSDRKITQEQFNEGKRELLVDIEDFEVCSLTPEVIRLTVDFIEKCPLKTLDAIHLASCVMVGAVYFVSSDLQQLNAAKASNLNVIQV